MEQNSFVPDEVGSPCKEEGVPSAKVSKNNKEMTRRDFVSRIGKIIGAGALIHFGLLSGIANAVDLSCNVSAADTCAPPADPDFCPYGDPAADSCNPTANDPDNCPDGSGANDECPAYAPPEDRCFSGQDPEDKCAKDGGHAAGDLCQGGGGTTNGKEQDTCEPSGAGDECNPDGGLFEGHDACKEDTKISTDADVCDLIHDDTCYNGKDIGFPGTGGDDWCDTAGLASDACLSGDDTQDLCENGLFLEPDVCYGATTDNCLTVLGDPDECPSGGCNEDKCVPGYLLPPGSPDECEPSGTGGLSNDECSTGEPAEDKCPGGVANEDFCPGGKSSEDECPAGKQPEDECPKGESSADECPTNAAPEDTCTAEPKDHQAE